MAQVNVNRKVADPFYRYKMPQLIAKVEGRGNGIKTVVVNMVDIAKALRRPPLYPTKFLGIELGAQVGVDSKNERYIVNGAHDGSKLQDLLYDFIEKYILCPECDNPETEITVLSKKECIKIKCKACGNRSVLSHAHRLNVYIMKNPPPSAPVTINHQQEAVAPISNGISHDDPRMIPEESKPSSLPTNTNLIATEENLKWYADTSLQAVQERMQSLSVRAMAITANADLEKSVEDRLNMFYAYAKKMLENPPTPECFHSISQESKRLDIDDTSVVVLTDILFDDGVPLNKVVVYKELFLKFTRGNSKAQRNVIGAMEVAASKSQDKVLPKLAQIFQQFYQYEIIEEDTFLKWSERKSTRFTHNQSLLEKIHKSAAPFITWLKTAEEESEGSSDTDVEVVFTQDGRNPVTSPHPTTTHATNGTTAAAKANDGSEEEEESVDIDEI